MNLQDKILEIKLIKESLDKRECEEFEMALQHKIQNCMFYKELKQRVGFKVYLKYVKGPSSRLFLKFRSCTHGLFEELGRHAKRDGSQDCPSCGDCKESVEHVLLSVHHTIPRDKNIFGTI